ncbi:hypothetical protein LTR72_001701 [Exophiala xenobiotica]|nr:hypothetical protein LTR92_009043 [Exophiala xenobiotica]KAK5230166.1 hypothetical protein LTR72_001701 [Exophiala xenobiotica]KAK5296133.1 hypothetical protein LTR14_003764 [Exophiala xenobiotica]KAK5492546.1 hypothetical protein LTR55_003901 [Exophiala xenobiotica]
MASSTGNSAMGVPPTPPTPFPSNNAERTVAEKEGLVPKSPALSSETGERTIMEGATLSLLMGAFFPCIPVAIVSAVLLTLIFRNRIQDPYTVVQQITQVHSSDLINQTLAEVNQLKAGGNSVYWLWASKQTTPGTLHTIASITGKVMPFITSTSMALVAFFAGRRIIEVTKARKPESMPTPHQMSILISLLNGSGISPLWETIKYRFYNHESLVQPVPLAFWALAWIVMLTLAIQAVDSWFGVALQPATVDILKATNHTSAYGRELNSTMCSSLTHQLPCIGDVSLQCTYPCSITNWTTSANVERFGLQHAQEAAEVLMNNSYTNFVVNVSAGYDTYDYDDSAEHYFLADKRSNSATDFTTGTIAVTTQCKTITQNCNVSDGFTCGSYSAPSFSWTGAVGVDKQSATGPYNESSAGIQFFNDSALTIPVGNDPSLGMFTAQNPVPFLLWSKGFPPVDTSVDQFAQMRADHYLKYDASGDPVFILNCSMSIYRATYNWTNGAVPTNGLYDLELADPAYGAIYSAAFAMDSALGHLSMQDAAALAAYQHQPESLANTFASRFSAAATALAAGIAVPSQNIYEQERFNNVLVTKVPLLPLYVLIALKAIYALFALVLAGLAVMVAEPLTSQDVKERLTIDGLAVGLFEADAHHKAGVSEIQQLYNEHNKTPGDSKDVEEPPKIGMVQNAEGGWSWATSKKLAESFGLSTVTGLIKSDVKAGASTAVEGVAEGQSGLQIIGGLVSPYERTTF